jgi:hypothetical protein
MQYYNNGILCLEFNEFVPHVLKRDNFYHHRDNGNIIVHGRGGNGAGVLIEYESIKLKKHKKAVFALYGDPYKFYTKQPLIQSIVWDVKAYDYYSGYELPSGDKLPNTDTDLRGKTQINYVHRYAQNASWLNMLDRLTTDKQALKREFNISIAQFWDTATEVIGIKKVALPKNARRLKDKLKEYKANGYEVLIETHKFGNSHSAKVKDEVSEALLKEMIAHHNNHDDTNKKFLEHLNSSCKEKKYSIDRFSHYFL